MYIPREFREENRTVLHAFMRQYNFAAMVTNGEKGLVATHLPFYLDETRGEQGTLVAHMARANPQWQTFKAEQEALVIFQGPHTYITPSWYEPSASNVPTWNMALVHAYGVPRIIEDHDEVYALLKRLVNENEAGFESPWPIESSEDYVHRRISAIVGFEMAIARLEGKYKLSQNRSEADQQRVIEALSNSVSAPDQEVAALMEARHTPEPHSADSGSTQTA